MKVGLAFERKDIRIVMTEYAKAVYGVSYAIAEHYVRDSESLKEFYRDSHADEDMSKSITIGVTEDHGWLTAPGKAAAVFFGLDEVMTDISIGYIEDNFELKPSPLLSIEQNKNLARDMHHMLYGYQESKKASIFEWISDDCAKIKDHRYLASALIDHKLRQIHEETDPEKLITKMEQLVAFTKGLRTHFHLIKSSKKREDQNCFHYAIGEVRRSIMQELRFFKNRKNIPTVQESFKEIYLPELIQGSDDLFFKLMAPNNKFIKGTLRKVMSSLDEAVTAENSILFRNFNNLDRDFEVYVGQVKSSKQKALLSNKKFKRLTREIILKPHWAVHQLDKYHALLKEDRNDEATDLWNDIQKCLKSDWDAKSFKKIIGSNPFPQEDILDVFITYLNARNRLLMRSYYVETAKNLARKGGAFSAFFAQTRMKKSMGLTNNYLLDFSKAREEFSDLILDDLDGVVTFSDNFTKEVGKTLFGREWDKVTSADQHCQDAVMKAQRSLYSPALAKEIDEMCDEIKILEQDVEFLFSEGAPSDSAMLKMISEDAHQRALDEINEELHETKNALNIEKSRAENLEDSVVKLQGAVDALRPLVDKLDEAKEENTNLRTQLGEVDENLGACLHNIRELSDIVAYEINKKRAGEEGSSEGKGKEKSSRLVGDTKSIEYIRDETKAQKLADTVTELTTKVRELEAEVTTAITKLNAEKKRVADLEEVVEEQSQTILNLERDNATLLTKESIFESLGSIGLHSFEKPGESGATKSARLNAMAKVEDYLKSRDLQKNDTGLEMSDLTAFRSVINVVDGVKDYASKIGTATDAYRMHTKNQSFFSNLWRFIFPFGFYHGRRGKKRAERFAEQFDKDFKAYLDMRLPEHMSTLLDHTATLVSHDGYEGEDGLHIHNEISEKSLLLFSRGLLSDLLNKTKHEYKTLLKHGNNNKHSLRRYLKFYMYELDSDIGKLNTQINATPSDRPPSSVSAERGSTSRDHSIPGSEDIPTDEVQKVKTMLSIRGPKT